MTNYSYNLDVPGGRALRLAQGWLFLAVGALVLSGLLAVLIVLSRTPYIGDIFPWVDLFHTALVVHVDLSVLVWFLAFAGMLWSMQPGLRAFGVGWGALALATAGTLIMTASPFLGATGPIMANYVPVLDHPLFLGGLLVFGLGFLLQVLYGLFMALNSGRIAGAAGALLLGMRLAMVAALVSMLALLWSWVLMPDFIKDKEYYEILFWGGGHVLQFMHTQLVMVVWLVLATVSGVRLSVSPRLMMILFTLGILAIAMTPVIYVLHEVHSGQHRMAFTWMMGFGNGLAAAPLSLALLVGVLTSGRGSVPEGARPERAALAFSVLLFGVGGIIGFMISGSNTIVPAHYHGSIVGITMAFMGLTYHLLPRMGFGPVPRRMAYIQPFVFGTGQLMHVFGLAFSGGHGVQRKTAGAAQGLEKLPEILGMAFMGLGGLVAIIGGVLFLVVVYRSVTGGRGGRPQGTQSSD